MKFKLILCLALVLSGIFAMQRAYGLVVEIQINHANLKTDFSFLKIKTAHINFTNDEVVVFTVIVIPEDKQQPEHFEGRLEISDTNIGSHHGYIAQTWVQGRKLLNEWPIEEIPKWLRPKCVVFQFDVSVKYLETSEFRVEETTGDVAGDGAPVDYIFNLKEFADEK